MSSLRGRHARRSAPARRFLPRIAAVAAIPVSVPFLASGAANASAAPHEALSAPQEAVTLAALHMNQVHQSEARASVSARDSYSVKPGDTLSAISASLLGSSSRWPELYGYNKDVIGPDPNLILAGQVLRLPPPSYSYTYVAPAPPPQPVSQPVSQSTYQAPSQPSSPSQPAQPSQPAYQGSSGAWPGGAFGNCVVERESGGNSQVMNGSGHYGLYQFSYSTWVGYGGAPGDFGHAGVAEQEQVFLNAMATPGGAENWAPYDGC